MKTARLLVLGVALAAGLGAALMVSGNKQPEVAPQVIIQAPPAQTDDVLVAAKDLGFGSVVQDGDLQWQSWQKDKIPAAFIRKSVTPNAIADFRGAIARSTFTTGEPMQSERLVKPGSAGFMSAMLTPGYRAVSISIQPNGNDTAGNFILPNDRVDVIRTYRDEEAARAGAGDQFISEVIARNIRVLAIGANLQEQKSEKVLAGGNATLELTPRQAEIISVAQQTPASHLSLALRSLTDSKVVDDQPGARQSEITIIRNGIAAQARTH